MQHNSVTDTSLQARADALLSQMSLAEKIGQMTQVEKDSITPEDAAAYFIGSVLSGGGGNPDPNNLDTWRAMVGAYIDASLTTRLQIPLIYGVDAVHGHNNLYGATIFPHNIALGATRDADLVERIAHATAREVLATHVRWNFAPALSVPQDIRWGRTYEGFSEDTALVTELGSAYLRGLQRAQPDGAWVLASIKHFGGDGGTIWDSRREMPYSSTNNWQAASENWRIDQGDTRLDEAALRSLHLAPYPTAIAQGAENVMVSFSSWNGVKLHGHRYLLTDLLKGEWGFPGFLVSDWMGVHQLNEDYYQAVVTTVNAGMDMVMVPFDYKAFISMLTTAVEKGEVPIERIDDAVRRILRVKLLLGLFEQPHTDPAYTESVGHADHRALAREAVRKSLVLLKNEKDTLPIAADARVIVAGQAADDIGLACGGWTISWQGGAGETTIGRTLLDGLRHALGDNVVYAADADFGADTQADVGVVVLAETPYAEGEGDREDLRLSADELALIERVRGHCARLVLVLYSGRPVVITDALPHCDAVVAAWQPGSEADAAADPLLGRAPFLGKLPFTWPRRMDQLPRARIDETADGPLYPFGHGITTHA